MTSNQLAQALDLLAIGETEAALRLLDLHSDYLKSVSVAELIAAGRALVAYGHPAQAVELLERGTRLGAAGTSTEFNAALAWLGIAYLELDAAADAAAICALTEREEVAAQCELLLLHARMLHQKGVLDQAAVLYRDGMSRYHSTQQTVMLLLGQGMIWQDRQDLDAARADWRRAERMAALIGDRPLLAWSRRLLNGRFTRLDGLGDTAAATPPPMLYIRLLGGFAVERGQDVLEMGRWKRHKAITLLQFLALQPQGRATRERALEALWGEEASHNALYVTLHDLRQGLSAGLPEPTNYIALQNGIISIAPSLYLGSDLQHFRSCIQAARAHWGSDRQLSLQCYRRAITMYDGELLAGVSECLWLLPQRETVRQMALEALVRLAQAPVSADDDADRLSLWMRALEIEPGHEEAVREIMQLQWSRGQRAAAHRCFTHYALYVRQELGAEPAIELLRLNDQINRSGGGEADGTDDASTRGSAPAGEFTPRSGGHGGCFRRRS